MVFHLADVTTSPVDICLASRTVLNMLWTICTQIALNLLQMDV